MVQGLLDQRFFGHKVSDSDFSVRLFLALLSPFRKCLDRYLHLG